MSQWNSSKANYHPVSQLPGNEYYSVEGMAPRLRFEHTSTISSANRQYSQSYRIDPLYSLIELKQKRTTLTPYTTHQPEIDTCRDRYIFVPKYVPRGECVKHTGLEEFKNAAEDTTQYRLKEVDKLPDADYHVLPKEGPSDDTYRIYKPTQPYDMIVLRDTYKFNPRLTDQRKLGADNTFISSTTIGSKP